jgi:hypothetical protein
VDAVHRQRWRVATTDGAGKPISATAAHKPGGDTTITVI